RACRPIISVSHSSVEHDCQLPAGFPAMMARWLYVLALATMSLGSGCCCFPCGGGYRLPPPIMWNGACNECGPSAGQSCASCGGCRGAFGLFPGLRHCLGWGKGCGEVYIN